MILFVDVDGSVSRDMLSGLLVDLTITTALLSLLY